MYDSFTAIGKLQELEKDSDDIYAKVRKLIEKHNGKYVTSSLKKDLTVVIILIMS